MRFLDTILLAPAVALSFLGSLGFRGVFRAGAECWHEMKRGEFAN